MTPEHRHPRRRDRSKDETWIRALLHRGEAAVMAAVLDGQPVCLPRLYAYDEEREAVYVHGAYGGVTGKVLEKGASVEGASEEDAGKEDAGEDGPGEKGAPVAMTVYEMGRLLPADEALEFGVEYRSVVLTGRAVEVDDPEEALRGLELIMAKYAPHLEAGEDYAPIQPEELIRTSVVRIDIESWSGKEKDAPEDFPGAYRLEEVR
ncbi:MAG: pyridoxamine 5'-phosphate oxidase family protein [Gemmatimonadota bacterium]|jgi:nitroimidazol reductase NimA-like FMN-containing flavoprotein (pyridoxamine 5'-phosphate oxidase superfamily)